MMLDTITYTRDELLNLYKMERFDSLKAKLKRRGYKFTTQGRGANATVTITETPPRFREFCIEVLGCDPHVDFKRLKIFLYKFFVEEGFRDLPFTIMSERMQEETSIGRTVCPQTISNWIDILKRNDIVAFTGEYHRYIIKCDIRTGRKYVVEADKKIFYEGWNIYFRMKRARFTYRERYETLYNYLGGHPCKIEKLVDNAFGAKKADELTEILKKEIDIDE